MPGGRTARTVTSTLPEPHARLRADPAGVGPARAAAEDLGADRGGAGLLVKFGAVIFKLKILPSPARSSSPSAPTPGSGAGGSALGLVAADLRARDGPLSRLRRQGLPASRAALHPVHGRVRRDEADARERLAEARVALAGPIVGSSAPRSSGPSAGATARAPQVAIAFSASSSTSSTCSRSCRSTVAASAARCIPAFWAVGLARPARPPDLPAEPDPDHHSRRSAASSSGGAGRRGTIRSRAYYASPRGSARSSRLLRTRRAPRDRDARTHVPRSF